MNTIDTYIVQDNHAQRHANLANEVRDAQIIQTTIGQRLMQARSWLGTRFSAWGQERQGPQETKLEWTHW